MLIRSQLDSRPRSTLTLPKPGMQAMNFAMSTTPKQFDTLVGTPTEQCLLSCNFTFNLSNYCLEPYVLHAARGFRV